MVIFHSFLYFHKKMVIFHSILYVYQRVSGNLGGQN